MRIGVASVLITAAGLRFEQLDRQVDRRGRNLRLVALHVDEDIDVRQLAGDFGHAVGAAGAVGAGQLDLAAERRGRRRRFPRSRPPRSTPLGRVARDAASYVCWISGLPVSASSSLRGSRVEASRAGMTIVLRSLAAMRASPFAGKSTWSSSSRDNWSRHLTGRRLSKKRRRPAKMETELTPWPGDRLGVRSISKLLAAGELCARQTVVGGESVPAVRPEKLPTLWPALTGYETAADSQSFARPTRKFSSSPATRPDLSLTVLNCWIYGDPASSSSR